MVAMRTQFLFSMPFTSLPLRSFLANMSMLIVQSKAHRQTINQNVRCYLSVAQRSLSKGCTVMSREGAFFLQTQPRRLYKGCCCQFQQGGGWEAGAVSSKWSVCKMRVCVCVCRAARKDLVLMITFDQISWLYCLFVFVFLQCDCRLCPAGYYATFLHKKVFIILLSASLFRSSFF